MPSTDSREPDSYLEHVRLVSQLHTDPTNYRAGRDDSPDGRDRRCCKALSIRSMAVSKPRNLRIHSGVTGGFRLGMSHPSPTRRRFLARAAAPGEELRVWNFPNPEHLAWTVDQSGSPRHVKEHSGTLGFGDLTRVGGVSKHISVLRSEEGSELL